MFCGVLKRDIVTCNECDCLHKEVRTQWVDDARREVIYYRCWGVSEPFDVTLSDLSKPCRAYPDNYKQVKFTTMEEFAHSLDREEIKDLIQVLKDEMNEH